MVTGNPRQRSNSSNEGSDSLDNTQQDDSPTLPPTPGDNGIDTLNPAPNYSPNQITSPTITPPLSSNSPGQSGRQSLASPNHSSIQTNNPSPIITTSTRRHYHHNHHHHHGEGRRNYPGEPHLSLAPHVDPAPAPAMYWSKARTHGKPSKALRAHTVNLVGELMYVFGGCDAKTCFNSILIFDADTMYWNRARTIGDPPPICRAHSSTLVDKKLFIFGGGDGPTYFNDLFIFDTDVLEWIKPKTSGNIPSPRRAHTSAYYNNHLYIFGGGDGFKALNDVYILNISDLNNLVWQKLEPKGRPPISRGYHTTNLVGSKLVVYGGSDGHECFSDVYVLDLESNTWIQAVEKSYPRLSHTATQVGSYLFIVCGHDGSKYTSEVLLLNLVTMEWERRKVYGTPPSGRGYHTTVLYDSRLFVFGGYDGHSVFDDVYVLDLSACAYLPQITNFQLPEL
ncbi:galactose oxidase [Rhizophagus irregularis]|uniref:Galactose oxidase n=1 Tax=Rhizophagus irregularis TaxID=588596 RepID=A0A2I1FYP2_9GLOM|nr:galactose oxidase [Rhizophagus irregularis]